MRSTTIIDPKSGFDVIKDEIAKIMVEHGYVFKTFKGEQLFKKGNGWLTAPMFFKFTNDSGKLKIQAWIKNALLPGWYIGESGLQSGFGFAIKYEMNNILREIISKFKREASQIEGYAPKEKKGK